MARNENSVKNRGIIDWKRKLTSRKFWLSIASFTAMLLVALGKSQDTATQVTSLIMAGASVIGYVIGEGLADGGHGTADDGHGMSGDGHGTADDADNSGE